MTTFTPTSPSLLEMREIRCPRCKRLLLKVRGAAEIEIVCHRCGAKVQWPNLDMAIVVQEARTHKVLAQEEFSTSVAASIP